MTLRYLVIKGSNHTYILDYHYPEDRAAHYMEYGESIVGDFGTLQEAAKDAQRNLEDGSRAMVWHKRAARRENRDRG